MLRINRILVPTDFSEHSEYAWHLACSLAKDHGARLIVVHAKGLPVVGYAGVGVPPAEENEAELRVKLSEIEPTVPSLYVERKILSGEPATAIVDFAKAENVDLIVMGSHGRTGLGRFLLGSVAELVTRRAACPVLILKHPMEAVEEADAEIAAAHA